MLAILEMAAISSIHIRTLHGKIFAVFRVALQLPFVDPALSKELHRGPVRMWRDQKRILTGDIPIERQIMELHRSRLLGNLAWVHRLATERPDTRLWMIETHAGALEERLVALSAFS